MAITSALERATLTALGVSRSTLSRRAQRLAREHGPMSGDEARWIIAHDAGVDLGKYGLSAAQLDRVRELRSSILIGGRDQKPAPAVANNAKVGKPAAIRKRMVRPLPTSPGTLFDIRGFHEGVIKSGRKLFVGGHHTEAVRRTFQGLSVRVRKLTELAKDGAPLMGEAFSESNPILRATALSTTSEKDEHNGMRFLMTGAMLGLRNPRSHEEQWEPDRDPTAVLEALAFASLLHRFLDRCEEYKATAP